MVTMAAFMAASCSKAVNVPLNPGPQAMKGTYRVTLTNHDEFNTRDLVVRADSVLFTSGKPYAFARDDVKSIERYETDGTKTAIAVCAACAVAVVGFIALIGAIGEGWPSN